MLLLKPFHCSREVWQVVRHSYHRRLAGVIPFHKVLVIPLVQRYDATRYVSLDTPIPFPCPIIVLRQVNRCSAPDANTLTVKFHFVVLNTAREAFSKG